MKVSGIGNMIPANSTNGTGGNTEAIQKQLNKLYKELSALSSKEQLSKTEQQKKQALEKQIANLKQQLSQTRAAEKNKQAAMQRAEENQREQKRLQEKTEESAGLCIPRQGKGEEIDELI